MELLLTKLRGNRVIAEIEQNEYAEDIFFSTEPEEKRFTRLDNLYDIYNQKIPPPAPVSLLYIILNEIDPTISLFDKDSVEKKVNEFTQQLDLNLDNEKDAYRIFGLKKYKITKDDVRKAIHSNDQQPKYALLVYASKLLNTCILVENTDTYIKTNSDTLLIFEYINGVYRLTDKTTTTIWKQKKIEVYIQQHIIEKIDSLLVKDLKQIATTLSIPLTTKIKKSELKKNILLVIHGGLEETRETG